MNENSDNRWKWLEGFYYYKRRHGKDERGMEWRQFWIVL